MLDSQYIVGFVDGEGCFSITINKNSGRLPEVRLLFEIELREDDRDILCQIQEVLNCGTIYHLSYERYQQWHPHVKYKVGNFHDISTKIIPFFRENPLRAKKRFQFQRFCTVAEMMSRKEHLTAEGIQRIASLRNA